MSLSPITQNRIRTLEHVSRMKIDEKKKIELIKREGPLVKLRCFFSTAFKKNIEEKHEKLEELMKECQYAVKEFSTNGPNLKLQSSLHRINENPLMQNTYKMNAFVATREEIAKEPLGLFNSLQGTLKIIEISTKKIVFSEKICSRELEFASGSINFGDLQNMEDGEVGRASTVPIPKNNTSQRLRVPDPQASSDLNWDSKYDPLPDVPTPIIPEKNGMDRLNDPERLAGLVSLEPLPFGVISSQIKEIKKSNSAPIIGAKTATASAAISEPATAPVIGSHRKSVNAFVKEAEKDMVPVKQIWHPLQVGIPTENLTPAPPSVISHLKSLVLKKPEVRAEEPKKLMLKERKYDFLTNHPPKPMSPNTLPPLPGVPPTKVKMKHDGILDAQYEMIEQSMFGEAPKKGAPAPLSPQPPKSALHKVTAGIEPKKVKENIAKKKVRNQGGWYGRVMR
jgi:hypothetical protein